MVFNPLWNYQGNDMDVSERRRSTSSLRQFHGKTYEHMMINQGILADSVVRQTHLIFILMIFPFSNGWQIAMFVYQEATGDGRETLLRKNMCLKHAWNYLLSTEIRIP